MALYPSKKIFRLMVIFYLIQCTYVILGRSKLNVRIINAIFLSYHVAKHIETIIHHLILLYDPATTPLKVS